jgi:hypothetical protein
MTMATNAESEEVVTQLAELMVRLVELLLVHEEMVAFSKTNFSFQHLPEDFSGEKGCKSLPHLLGCLELPVPICHCPCSSSTK